jgi:Tol biopolymer transport system component
MTRSRVGPAVALTLLLAAGCSTPSGPAASSRPAAPTATGVPYATARFTTAVDARTFGQDPTWTTDGRVLSNEPDRSGVPQVYVSRLDGTAARCLTCGQPGPNGFPLERPQGDWILFCSFRGQRTTFGAPCLGGMGTDLYAMRPDGSGVTRLTGPGTTVPGDAPGDASPYDNYHPAWSPDGRRIVWTRVHFAPLSAGGTQWTVLLAGFGLDASGRPRLGTPTMIAPMGDTAYETQTWAPDGSGVLVTRFSSDGDRAVGWLNSELWFVRLRGDGASAWVHLTDGNPGWDEQAVYTPDGRDVIWMSSRGSPTWAQTVVTAARSIGYDPPGENEVFGPFFILTILDPAFRTDLYELDLATGSVRRLTELDSVVPEFTFDPGGTRVLWTSGDHRRTFLGTFAGVDGSARPSGSPRVVPDPRWVGAPVHGAVVALPPVGTRPPDLGAGAIPVQQADAVGLLEAQLGDLATRLQGLPRGGTCCGASAA